MSIFRKKRMLNAIKLLEGTYVVSIGRAADMIEISFDNQSVELRKERKEYVLHIQTPCRITLKDDIILGSYDIYLLSDKATNEEWDVRGNNVYDVKVRDEINLMFPLKVEKASCNDIGDIELYLENNMIISVFINDTKTESWRVMDVVTDKHYVNSEL